MQECRLLKRLPCIKPSRVYGILKYNLMNFHNYKSSKLEEKLTVDISHDSKSLEKKLRSLQ